MKKIYNYAIDLDKPTEDQFNHCIKVKQLSFLMYSFYSHSRRKSDEFVLQGTYNFQK